MTFPASTSQRDLDLTWIHADGYALQTVMMNPADVEEVNLEPFLLPPKQVVRGRLYDGARRPIGGATVIFHTVDRMRITAEAVTEADGGFMTPVREWAIIQGDPQIAQRYRWSILHDDKAEGGYRKRTTTPLNVISNEAGELVLELPTGK